MDNFDAAEEGGGNFFSIFSAFFIFFAYIPFSIDMLFPQLHGRIRKLISILLILSTAVTTIFFGSRFAIMTPLLYGVIILFYSKRIKFSFKVVLWRNLHFFSDTEFDRFIVFESFK